MEEFAKNIKRINLAGLVEQVADRGGGQGVGHAFLQQTLTPGSTNNLNRSFQKLT